MVYTLFLINNPYILDPRFLISLWLEQNTMFIGRIPPRGVKRKSEVLRPMGATIMVTRHPIRMGPWSIHGVYG